MMWWSEGRDQPVVKQLCSAALAATSACFFTCSLARCKNFGKDWTVLNFGYCGRNKKNSSPKLEPLWNRFTVLDSQISVLSVFLRKKNIEDKQPSNPLSLGTLSETVSVSVFLWRWIFFTGLRKIRFGWWLMEHDAWAHRPQATDHRGLWLWLGAAKWSVTLWTSMT